MDQQTLKELNDKAKALINEGRYEEARSLCDKIIQDFGKSKEPGIPEQVARALNNKGVVLGQQGKPEEAIKLFDEAIFRFEKSREPEILESVAKALNNKGVVLRQHGKPEEAIKLFDEVIQRFGKSKEPNILESVAKALSKKAWTLSEKKESLIKIRPVFNKLDTILDIMEEKGRDTSTLRSFAFKLLSIIKAQGKPAPGVNKKAKEKALKASKGNLSTRLEIYLADVQKHFGADKQREYFERINASKKRTDEFLTATSRFKENTDFFYGSP
jgi:tetratricopeptide (TPR) repeat protein